MVECYNIKLSTFIRVNATLVCLAGLLFVYSVFCSLLILAVLSGSRRSGAQMDEEETTYLIHKAKQAQANDPSAAKAWILATKTLYPNNFAVQFEAYTIEKSALNAEEAAKCLSYM